LIDDLVVQNYAYSIRGFEKDLNQPALVKARSWGLPVEIGILAGFGGRTPDMATLAEKVRLSAERGHGVIYFYWEGLWGRYAGREGGDYRREAFRQLHLQAFPPGAVPRDGAAGRPYRLPQPPSPATLTPPPPPPLP
jgi:uncharacterized lipoprotein YddW (UPF0748 family)